MRIDVMSLDVNWCHVAALKVDVAWRSTIGIASSVALVMECTAKTECAALEVRTVAMASVDWTEATVQTGVAARAPATVEMGATATADDAA